MCHHHNLLDTDLYETVKPLLSPHRVSCLLWRSGLAVSTLLCLRSRESAFSGRTCCPVHWRRMTSASAPPSSSCTLTPSCTESSPGTSRPSFLVRFTLATTTIQIMFICPLLNYKASPVKMLIVMRRLSLISCLVNSVCVHWFQVSTVFLGPGTSRLLSPTGWERKSRRRRSFL